MMKRQNETDIGTGKGTERFSCDPCAASSLPFWKTEQRQLPAAGSVYLEEPCTEASRAGTETPYFKTIHRKIRRASGKEMLALWGYPDLDTAPPTARFFFQNIVSGNAIFWTVDRDGELIGELYAFLNIPEDPDFADGTTTAYLCAFRVKQDCRGQGLGRRLMGWALSDLRSMGFRRVTIGVDEARNEAFYRRLGFVTAVKTCYLDPCARDEAMQPEPDEVGYLLLAKEL